MENIIVRLVQHDDLDQIYPYTKQLGVGNGGLFQTSKNGVGELIEKSITDFSKDVQSPGPERYILVMEEDNKKVIGFTVATASTGTGIYSFEVNETTIELKKALPNGTLLHGSFIASEYRNKRLGTLMSNNRLKLIKTHPKRFHTHLIGEMRGVYTKEGVSPFWQEIGQKFGEDWTYSSYLKLLREDEEKVISLIKAKTFEIKSFSEKTQAIIRSIAPEVKTPLQIILRQGFKLTPYIGYSSGAPIYDFYLDTV